MLSLWGSGFKGKEFVVFSLWENLRRSRLKFEGLKVLILIYSPWKSQRRRISAPFIRFSVLGQRLHQVLMEEPEKTN